MIAGGRAAPGPPARRAYDLTTAAADYPSWHGPPRRTVLICAHPRSGSTLLGEAVYAVGGLGCPLEYLHRGFRPGFAERWEALDLFSFKRAVHQHRTDPSGVLAAKLFWSDVEETVREHGQTAGKATADAASEPSSDDPHILSVLKGLFPDPTFVHLWREDRVRQAVSGLVAEQTQRWRSLPGNSSSARGKGVTYDFARILRLIALADYSEMRWRQFFASNRITPRELTYEQLIAKDRRPLRELLAGLGYAGPLPATRLIRQADALSESFVLRFLREYGANGEAIAPERSTSEIT